MLLLLLEHGQYQELKTSRTSDGGNTNTTAKNLQQFIEKTTEKKGYYLGRYESSDASIGNSLNGKEPVGNITQPNAAKAAREYKNGDSYVSADLLNSYMWDTAIVFIQKCSSKTQYACHSSGASIKYNAGASSDVVCNIYDLAGNLEEWTTEYSLDVGCGSGNCTRRLSSYNYNTDQGPGYRNASVASSTFAYQGYRVGLWVL